MTICNADSANNTGLPHADKNPVMESHRHYEFGTFAERLEHFCMLFEVDPPEIVYEDGEPTLTKALIEWSSIHSANMNWLIGGSPCTMLKDYAKNVESKIKLVGDFQKMVPEVQTGFLAYLRAVVIHGIPMKEAEPLLTQVLEEFRASETA
ncbi:hypothetical protein [Sedimentitalea todarodis]|uniref:Uncharacterized protein n=1 Tax=Sedimentitalea todarodis TaxID=1631240 RepID=A0ABU3VHR7_9RHOB|nr:hypothetical protein [Sedimentitalea todarodis]MDU9005736.1 hypothetical protein [Sedimentitalea todarodis]